MRVTCVLFISGILLTGADAVRSVKQLQPAIERNDYGKGSKTEVLDVKVGDTKKKIRTDIEVSERRYTTEEIQELFGRIIRRMDRLILNENQTPDHVETDLNLITEIPGEPVTVSWELDRYDVMNVKGEIQEKNIAEKGTLVKLNAVLTYTENEKEHIAREHLIPKQIKANGLKENQLVIGDDVLKNIIEGYTKEAGVRNLERKFGEICRKSARKILQDKEKQVVVTKDNLEEFLGRSRYTYQKVNEKDEIGIVRGLAWTSVGGDTLQIEVNLMPGKGEFLLTGQLGDVMKESAQAGISYIRSVADQYAIKPEFFKEHDLHIHIPEGAVPKDGPSAGITMATAMLSAITGRAVRANLAMTGEITLRGRVLPIGGLKEKMLAAKNAGITKILVPDQNRPDVEEIDAEIKEGLTIVFVEKMEQVLKEALV